MTKMPHIVSVEDLRVRPFAEAVCAEVVPALAMDDDGRAVACHMLTPGSGHSRA